MSRLAVWRRIIMRGGRAAKALLLGEIVTLALLVRDNVLPDEWVRVLKLNYLPSLSWPPEIWFLVALALFTLFVFEGSYQLVHDAESRVDPTAATQGVNGARLLVTSELELAADQIAMVRMTRPHNHYSKDFALSTEIWERHGPVLAEAAPILFSAVASAYSAIQWVNKALAMRRTRQGNKPETLAVIGDDHLDVAEAKIAEAISTLRRSGEVVSLEANSETFQPTQLPYAKASTRLNLRVQNISEGPVRDCRVRLDDVERQQDDGSWHRIDFFSPGFRQWEDGAETANLGPGEPMHCPLVEHDREFGTYAHLVRGPSLKAGVIRLTASIRVANNPPTTWRKEAAIGALGDKGEAQTLEWRP